MKAATINLPYRLEPFGGRGYTSSVMSTKDAAMPCWNRFDIIDGLLVQTR